MVRHLTEKDNFDDLLKKDLLLVDFYADWCGPCQRLAPILEEIDFIDVLKVNTDEFPLIASRFGIMSIPTLIFFKNGQEVQKLIGLHSKEDIQEIYNSLK